MSQNPGTRMLLGCYPDSHDMSWFLDDGYPPSPILPGLRQVGMRSASPDGGDPDGAGPAELKRSLSQVGLEIAQEIIGCIHHSCVLILLDQHGPAHSPRMLGIPNIYPTYFTEALLSTGIGQLRSMVAAPHPIFQAFSKANTEQQLKVLDSSCHTMMASSLGASLFRGVESHGVPVERKKQLIW